MRIVAQYEILNNQRWSDPFSARPVFHDGCAWFPFYGIHEICCLKLSTDGSSSLHTWNVPAGMKIPLSNQWNTFIHDGIPAVTCGDVILDLRNMRPAGFPEEIKEKYPAGQTLDAMKDVHLFEYILRCKNSSTIECYTEDGRLLWSYRHKGYRYTPFEEVNGCVIFGTAGGHGGGVYTVRLADGECLCAVDTKGTPRLCRQKGRLLSRGREGKLLWIDPYSGNITDSLTFPGKLNDDSGIFADERYVCTTGFREKKDKRLPCFYIVDTWLK